MKVFKKKKQVFGELYLGNTVLALSAFAQSSIAQDEYLSKQDVLNVCNQISWRIIANNTIVEAKEGSWITKEEYSNSIRNVIGKAFADCITERNEFAGKTSIEDTITFDVDPRKNKYTEANWNAVVLWNLIHVYNCEFKDNENYTIDEAFKKVEENVKSTYSAEIEGFDKILEKAISDIKEYAKALDFKFYLRKYSKLGKQNMKAGSIKTGFNNNVAPWMYLCNIRHHVEYKNNEYKYSRLILNTTHIMGIEAKDADKEYYSLCEFECRDTCWYLRIYGVRFNGIEYHLTDKEEEKRDIYSKMCSKIIQSLVKKAEIVDKEYRIEYKLDPTEMDEMLK